MDRGRTCCYNCAIMENNAHSSENVIEFIELQVLTGKLTVGDRLPAERELAHTLGVSRTAVREGIRLLEVTGIVEARQGSGNYITRHFDRTLEHVLTMMYALEGLDCGQIREFLYAVERQALVQAVRNDNREDRLELQQHLEGLLHGKTEEEQSACDHRLHSCLVRMSGNRMVIANYTALDRIISQCICEARKTIRDELPGEFLSFQNVHRRLVDAVLQGDLEAAKAALDEHYRYITRNIKT